MYYTTVWVVGAGLQSLWNGFTGFGLQNDDLTVPFFLNVLQISSVYVIRETMLSQNEDKATNTNTQNIVPHLCDCCGGAIKSIISFLRSCIGKI